MKKCKICGVDVASDKSYCPLCYNDLDDDQSKEYPLTIIKTKNVKSKHVKAFLAKLFLLISLATIAVCVYANLEAKTSYLWCLVVVVSILYLWILVAHTILSRRSIFEKIAFQIIGVVAIVGTTYALSPTPTTNWLVSFVLPGISMFAILTLMLISFISKDRKRYLLSFVAVYLALLVMSIVFVNTIDEYKVINNINMLVCAIVSLGTIILGYKAIHREFVKIFNL